MGGAFIASPVFDHDEGRTADEIRRCGWIVERWIDGEAPGAAPELVSWELIRKLHRMWFHTAFPDEAGTDRKVVVMNRKGTALDPASDLVASTENACRDWCYRQNNLMPDDPVDQIEFAITEANTLVIRVYDIHPFLDGNTRATFSLRNFLLVRAGIYGLINEYDTDGFLDAWWDATPESHVHLDALVLQALIEQDLRRAEHNRVIPS